MIYRVDGRGLDKRTRYPSTPYIKSACVGITSYDCFEYLQIGRFIPNIGDSTIVHPMNLGLTISISQPLDLSKLRLSLNGVQFQSQRVLGYGASGVVLSFINKDDTLDPLRNRVAVKVQNSRARTSCQNSVRTTNKPERPLEVRVNLLHDGAVEVLDHMDLDLYEFIISGELSHHANEVAVRLCVDDLTSQSIVIGAILRIVREQILLLLHRGLDYSDIKCENIMIKRISDGMIAIGLGDLDGVSARGHHENGRSTFITLCERHSASDDTVADFTVLVLFIHTIALLTNNVDILTLIQMHSLCITHPLSRSSASKTYQELLDNVLEDVECGRRYNCTFAVTTIRHMFPVFTSFDPVMSNMPDIYSRQEDRTERENDHLYYCNHDDMSRCGQHNKLHMVHVAQYGSSLRLEMMFEDSVSYAHIVGPKRLYKNRPTYE